MPGSNSKTEPIILRDERFSSKPLNGCSGCRQDFTSLRLFDAHRVGSYAYLWSPDHQDGRRCLSVDEMAERGWTQDEKGRWIDLERAQRTREAFEKSSLPCTGGPNSPSEALDDLEAA